MNDNMEEQPNKTVLSKNLNIPIYLGNNYSI